jgi:hypothetical protein
MKVKALMASSGRGKREGLMKPVTVVSTYQTVSTTSTVATPTRVLRYELWDLKDNFLFLH